VKATAITAKTPAIDATGVASIVRAFFRKERAAP
jgi:hypothetical protein